MIGAFVDYALNNRFIVVVVAVLLLACGAIAFHSLPVEAYPDVANNYVQVITQWPGHAAEEVEQQVTIPVEIQMNGIPHLQHMRSVSIFGLSSVMLIFDDQSVNDWNRQSGSKRRDQSRDETTKFFAISKKVGGRDRDRTLLVLQCAKEISQSSDQANDET